nr:pyridoxamine 5'-phosphate oxidase family protein [Streptomyces sp. 5-10]
MDSAEHLDDRAWRPGSDGEHHLQRRLGTVDRADRFYDDQVLDHLNVRMREFIGRQEMFFLATSDRHGECDSTFRAGPPGFLRVLDTRTLAYPEYRGNGVLASLGNIQENPHLGILMVDFFRDRIGLHVNGRARVVEDAEMREAHADLPLDPVPGRRAVVWVEVTVEEAYIHCAKHIPHLQKVPAQRRTGGGDAAGRRGLSGDQALEHGRERDWGTDDVKRKGGDFFGAAAEAREGRRVPPAPPASPTPSGPHAPSGPLARPAPHAPSAPLARPAPPAPPARSTSPAQPVPSAPPVSRPSWAVDLPGQPARPVPVAQAELEVSGPQAPAAQAAPDPQPLTDSDTQVLAIPPAPPTSPVSWPVGLPPQTAPTAQDALGPQAPAAGPAARPDPAAQPEPAARPEAADLARRAAEPSVVRDLSPAIRPPVRPDAGPEDWREEAERVLAEARQRAARKTQQPFSGWFR